MTPRPFAPRPYQTLGFEFLLDVPRANLWAGMGLGKTVTVLNVLDVLRLAGDGPALVLGPLRVARGVWPREVQKWAHLHDLRVSAIVGTERERLAALKTRADVYTLNYENIPWLFRVLLDGNYTWPWPIVVADESTRLKSMRSHNRTSKKGTEYVQSAGGKRPRQLARIAHTKVQRWINLTAKPAPNGLQDLWGQQWFVDAGARLGRTYEAFTQRWFRPAHNGYGTEALPFAEEQIHDRLRDCTLSLRTEDWFDVEKPLRSVVSIDLPPSVRRMYRDMEREMFAQVQRDLEVEVFNAAARSAKCLQLAAGFIYHGDNGAQQWTPVHDEKIEALRSIVEETNGEPLLVQYHFRPDRERILRAFPFARPLETQQDEDDWNAGKIRMLVAHAASCGHGLNLQDGGRILVRYSYWWALEEFDQILERIGPVRQAQAGHNRAVHEYIIVARNTVDEDVLLRHETKRAVEDVLLEAMTRRN